MLNLHFLGEITIEQWHHFDGYMPQLIMVGKSSFYHHVVTLIRYNPNIC